MVRISKHAFAFSKQQAGATESGKVSNYAPSFKIHRNACCRRRTAFLLIFLAIYTMIVYGGTDLMSPMLTATRGQEEKNLRRPISHVRWLHIPKTGSSFFSAIYNAFCPRLFHEHPELKQQKLKDDPTQKRYPHQEWCDNVTFFHKHQKGIGWHVPLATDGLALEHWRVLTMLRDPSERLFSAYAFGRHNSKVKNASQTLEEYIREPHIRSCQTKMLTGLGCYSEVPPGFNANVSLALERIKHPNFFFGITDRWEESICLFHEEFDHHKRSLGYTVERTNTTFGVEAFELLNNRPTNRKRNQTFPDDYYDADFDLFQQAVKLFDERLLETGCYGVGQ